MHKMRYRSAQGSTPDPAGGVSSAPQTPMGDGDDGSIPLIYIEHWIADSKENAVPSAAIFSKLFTFVISIHLYTNLLVFKIKFLIIPVS